MTCSQAASLIDMTRQFRSSLNTRVRVNAETFRLAGALARAIQLRGAMERVLTLSLEYASVRRQFGVPIARFQAVQQLLTTIAGEGAAASAAVDAAVRTPSPLRIAVAKSRTSEAAGIVAAAAHQVHGAVGFTQEHQLHHFTRRLWAWRDEFGTERAHAETVGRALAAAGPESLWEFIATSAGPPSDDDCLTPG
jgi:acyl-CoA dehydrogenase